MLGKGALLTVFGFILAFSNFQVNMSRNVMSTSDNFNNEYMEVLIHQTSMSVMNLAVNKIWDQHVNSETFRVVANSCSSLSEISPIGPDTVRVKVKSWGYLFDQEMNSEKLYADSIIAYFSNNMPISQYFWFTTDENGVYWVTGDSIWGPVHTNGTLITSGSPTFFSKVTAKLGMSPCPPAGSANFYGGWEIGVSNDIPTDMSHLFNAANMGNGGAPVNTYCLYDLPVTFDFQPDGSVIRTVQGNPTDTVMVASIAPTGAIYSTAEVRVKGTFKGQTTIMTTTNMWIDDDLVYADNPLINPNSGDLLGLVATNNIYVTDNAANNSDVYIQACVMAITGSFTAQNYSTRPVAGKLNMTGSIVQKKRGAVGTFNYSGIMTGFSKRYRFDSRLSNISPPNYPFVKSLSLVSWWE